MDNSRFDNTCSCYKYLTLKFMDYQTNKFCENWWSMNKMKPMNISSIQHSAIYLISLTDAHPIHHCQATVASPTSLVSAAQLSAVTVQTSATTTPPRSCTLPQHPRSNPLRFPRSSTQDTTPVWLAVRLFLELWPQDSLVAETVSSAWSFLSLSL